MWGATARRSPDPLDQLKRTYARYYVPNNAALIVTAM